MNLSFDYYHHLTQTEFYLCNPDYRELFPLQARNRKVTLRFNDLSELTFTCDATATKNDGTIVELDSYDYIETRRLVFATSIGWFVIMNVKETDDGIAKYKEVKCESLQATFKDRGVFTEERVYYLYNPNDATDTYYDDSNEAAVPSVIGQLYQQLGIGLSISTSSSSDPVVPYADWTITYVNSSLIGVARNFKEESRFGYEFMAKDVAEAFEICVLFDFYNKTIKFMTPSEVTTTSNVLYTFQNFMQSVDIEEDADNIVTVLDVNGDNCDISMVNPMGVKYICDFSYYMDAAGRWMSSDLKARLNAWRGHLENSTLQYQTKVTTLRGKYELLAQKQSDLQEISKVYTDLEAAVANKAIAIAGDGPVYGIVWAETVNTGTKSIYSGSSYYSSNFTSSSNITAYKTQPTFNSSTKQWVFSGSYITGTAEYCYKYEDASHNQYHYFKDASDGKSYCKLKGKAVLNQETYTADYTVQGFERFIDLNLANVWVTLWDGKKTPLEQSIASLETDIYNLEGQLTALSNSCNIVKYFASYPTLFKELTHYWIEGEYTNDNISITDETPIAESISLMNELMDSGYIELAKVCQPKLQFSLTSANCLNQYEFANSMRELALGKIVAVEKEEGLWYYPALLEMSYDLDNSDTFDLTFANRLRLDDWGYTYADLISSASSTSRQVNANWQNLTAYVKDKDEIGSLIRNPLSTTLRAATANMNNQEFQIDTTGILGRKFLDDGATVFSDEQMRIINNVILFTDDNWETAKTALGKLAFDDGQGGTTYAYGLIADTIIGNLIIGEKMVIKNSGNTVHLDGNGITIKNGNTTVFTATTNGTVTISGYATESELADKNKVFAQASAPSSTGRVTGDLWIDTDDSNKMYRWNGSSWVLSADTRIADAIAEAESKSKVYTQASSPGTTGMSVGDLWLDTDDGNKMYRWNGSSWVVSADTRIATAITEAESKNKVFSQASSPGTTGVSAGDLWIDTDDGNKMYCFDGSSWVVSADTRIATAITEAESKNKVYAQTTSPGSTGVSTGDLWLDTDDGNKMYRWNGSSWVVSADERIAAAITEAESKNKVYAQTSSPGSTGVSIGDLWLDTDDGNKMYRWNGTEWLVSADTRIAAVVTEVATKNRVYAQTASPGTTGMVTGDLWIDTDDNNKMYRWSGTAWVLSSDSRIATAMGAVSETQTVYLRQDTGDSRPVTAPSAWVTENSASVTYTWTTVIPTPKHNSTYYICEQTKDLSGTVTSGTVVEDKSGSTVLKWCASADTTQIDGGSIYTGSVTAAKIAASAITADKIATGVITADKLSASDIVTNLLTVKDSNSNVLFKADASNNAVQIAGFTVKKTALYTGDRTTVSDTIHPGVYIGTDGISMLNSGRSQSLVINLNNGTFTFTGGVNAKSGTFSNGVEIGTSNYPFYIGDGATISDNKSTCLYCRETAFPGMGGLGVTTNAGVYMGGDGFSYRYLDDSARDYLFATRPGFSVWLGNQGSTSGSNMRHKGMYMTPEKIAWCYGGSTNLRTVTTLSGTTYTKAAMTINDTGTKVNATGSFHFDSMTSSTSDRRFKYEIEEMDEKYDVLFDNIVPYTYKMVNGTSGRTHTGFIAQNVLEAINTADLTTTQFAAYIEDVDDGEKSCALRYGEFVSLNTWQIQLLKKRVKDLEDQVAALLNNNT